MREGNYLETLCPVCACEVDPRIDYECHICGSGHHMDCLCYSGGCAVFGCHLLGRDGTPPAIDLRRAKDLVARISWHGSSQLYSFLAMAMFLTAFLWVIAMWLRPGGHLNGPLAVLLGLAFGLGRLTYRRHRWGYYTVLDELELEMSGRSIRDHGELTDEMIQRIDSTPLVPMRRLEEFLFGAIAFVTVLLLGLAVGIILISVTRVPPTSAAIGPMTVIHILPTFTDKLKKTQRKLKTLHNRLEASILFRSRRKSR